MKKINREFNYTFILNYNDIFIKKDNKYYCLILFEKENIKRISWIIGEVLLKKYILIFNEEKGIIGFYIHNNKNSFFNFSISWILVLFFFFSTIILSYLLYKLIIKRKRKIRANELEDNVDYISKEDYKSINKIKL